MKKFRKLKIFSIKSVNPQTGKLATSACHPPLQGLNHVLLHLLDSSTPLKKLRSESLNVATLVSQNTGRTVLQIARYVQELFYESSSYISLYLRKHQNPSW